MKHHPSCLLLRIKGALAKTLFVALVTTAALTGCDTGNDAAVHADEPPKIDNPQRKAAPSSVRTALVQAIPDTITIREVGRLEPWRRVTISAEVGGTVKDVGFEVGALVPFNSDGGPSKVCSLEQEPFAIALRQASAVVAAARADLQLAEVRYRSVGDLYKKKLNSEMDYQQARITVAAARANLDGARAAEAEATRRQNKATITAPPGYRVTQRLVEPHQVVSPAQPIFELMDDRKLRLRFSIPGHLTGDLAHSQTVRFEIKGATATQEARVIRIGPDADRASGRFPVEAEIGNSDGTLLPGRIAVALLDRVRSTTPLAVVPRGAVYIQLAQKSVAVINAEGIVSRRTVQAVSAPQLDPQLLALTGVHPGERVALERVGTLRSGDRVVDPDVREAAEPKDTEDGKDAEDAAPVSSEASTATSSEGTTTKPAPVSTNKGDDGPA